MPVPTTPHTTKFTKITPIDHVIGDVQKNQKEFLKALSDPAWVEAMQEALQFKLQKIEEEVYVCQPPGFEDPDHPDKVYKVVKALYGLHQAPRALYDIWPLSFVLWISRGQIGPNLVQQKSKSIFISLDNMSMRFLRKFNYSDVKSASTPTDLEKPLVQDGDAADVDEHLYRSMIGSLMYLTASRPDIMFAVCACARFQVSPKTSHLLAVKRIFRYLKGKPSLGLWYSKDSPLELVAYTDSDYAGATLDRKSTTRGCQFLGNRLISWQCKKTNCSWATSTTEAEYVAAASCCGQFGGCELLMSNGEVKITATIDGYSMTITEASLRRHLKLDDQDGVTAYYLTRQIFELLGYHKPQIS
ncbi:putative ribonuclease H-like domain-containing protein [Tanacetum coccineum]|uniref:Ribonuclease H-like domain-containing protein n=1 Tax=Tanacetum coccineum TaxID=301880 RepID=A0ABQ5JBA6_9ASTR